MSKQCFIQGDLLFVKEFNDPPTRDPNKRHLTPLGSHPDRLIGKAMGVQGPVDNFFILAVGEQTGHSHRIAADNAEVQVMPADRDRPANDLVLALWQDAEVIHEEHPPLKLEPGTYIVRQQRDYDPYAVIREEDQRNISRARFD